MREREGGGGGEEGIEERERLRGKEESGPIFHLYVLLSFNVVAGYPIFAWKGQTEEEFWWCIDQCLQVGANIRVYTVEPL